MSKLVHHLARILPSSYALLRYLSATGDLQEIKDARLQHDQFKGILYQPSYKLLTIHSAEEALQLFQQMPQAPQSFALPFI